jgi:hypothetical protein
MRAGDWIVKPVGNAVIGWVSSIRMTSVPPCTDPVTDSMAVWAKAPTELIKTPKKSPDFRSMRIAKYQH